VKICENLRPILFYRISPIDLPILDFNWWALNPASFQGASWGLPLCGRSITWAPRAISQEFDRLSCPDRQPGQLSVHWFRLKAIQRQK